MKFFQRKKEEEKTPEAEALGWKAIANTFEAIYPDQHNPKHYGTLISWRL